MIRKTDIDNEHVEDSEAEITRLKERLNSIHSVIYSTHGYLDDDGEIDTARKFRAIERMARYDWDDHESELAALREKLAERENRLWRHESTNKELLTTINDLREKLAETERDAERGSSYRLQLAQWMERAEQAERQLEQAREALIEDATYIVAVRATRHGKPLGDDCVKCKSDQRELDRIGAVIAALAAAEHPEQP